MPSRGQRDREERQREIDRAASAIAGAYCASLAIAVARLLESKSVATREEMAESMKNVSWSPAVNDQVLGEMFALISEQVGYREGLPI